MGARPREGPGPGPPGGGVGHITAEDVPQILQAEGMEHRAVRPSFTEFPVKRTWCWTKSTDSGGGSPRPCQRFVRS